MQKLTDSLITRWLLVGVVGVLVLIPFHAFLTVWIASFGVDYVLVRLWKEAVLLLLFVGAGLLLWRSPNLRRTLAEHTIVRWTVLLIAGYVALHLLLGLIALMREAVTPLAFGYSMISNLRFLGFFMVALIVGVYYREWLHTYWRRVLLWPALVVIAFGLLQEFVLPFDVLRHFGYGPHTIAPYITVDEKIEYLRLQSTLRGPNPLGAYLVPIITALVALFIVRKKQYVRIGIALLAAITVLYGSYSRSAWIGAAAAVAVVVWALIHSERTRRMLLIAAAVGFLIGAASVYVFRDNPQVQNVLFHTDETSVSSTSSNEKRAGALLTGLEDVATQPLGRGSGTAGPASVYNESGARLSENYFIQIAQEVGVLGLGLFIAINVLVGLCLWRVGYSVSVLPLILLASFIGITLVNMLSHAWADDTLAYLWWGFAGLCIGASLRRDHQKA